MSVMTHGDIWVELAYTLQGHCTQGSPRIQPDDAFYVYSLCTWRQPEPYDGADYLRTT